MRSLNGSRGLWTTLSVEELEKREEYATLQPVAVEDPVCCFQVCCYDCCIQVCCFELA